MADEICAMHRCPGCGVEVEYPADLGGTTIDCPECSARISLPAAPADAASGPLAVDQILASFAGSIARPKTSFAYKIALLTVALLMVLLPLIYVACVILAGRGVYWYATEFIWLLQSTSGGARLYVFRVLAYAGPLFIGAVIIFFMIKPLLARRPLTPDPIVLDPAKEPVLFAFIHRICELVGAPHPRQVCVDCDVNASASFRRGFRSILGSDLQLTVGLPLVAAFDTRQLAGVIAHEFGHFAQGTGMRLTYIINRVNRWFARVIYQRDSWDATLDAWAAEAEDWRVKIVLLIAQIGVWFSRLLLKPLMFLGHALSCFLMRQMEYDADAYEIRIAGSSDFERTSIRLAQLAAATRKTYRELERIWTLRRLVPDNLPGFILCHDRKMPDSIRETIANEIGLSRTSTFDTHPSPADRIRQARRAAEKGIFHLERPAADLFTDYARLAERVTVAHYHVQFDLPLIPDMLRPAETLAEA